MDKRQKTPVPANTGGAPGQKRGAAFARGAARRCVWAVRLALGAALFAPIVLFMMAFNYTVDCSGMFQGDQTLRAIVEMLFAGSNVAGYDQFNERQRDMLELVVEKFDTAPNTVAIGSSRILQMNTELAGLEQGEFFNCGLTGADFLDILGSYYLFEKNGKLPETLIVGVDPWAFNANSVDARSDKTLYAEFLTNCLGIDTPYTAPDAREKWTALYSPSYFQDNVSYLRRTGGEIVQPTVVSGEALYEQSTEVKMADGSILYPIEMREKSQQAIDDDALATTNYGMLNLEDYEELDAERMELFEAFLTYVRGKGVNVIVLLSPYHPIDYDYMSETKPEHYASFLATEPAVRRIAAACGVPVYGSYNPYAIPGVTNADFYDALHCRGECIAKFFPGVPAALENLAAGVDVELDYETTREEAAVRDAGQSDGALLT